MRGWRRWPSAPRRRRFTRCGGRQERQWQACWHRGGPGRSRRGPTRRGRCRRRMSPGNVRALAPCHPAPSRTGTAWGEKARRTIRGMVFPATAATGCAFPAWGGHRCGVDAGQDQARSGPARRANSTEEARPWTSGSARRGRGLVPRRARMRVSLPCWPERASATGPGPVAAAWRTSATGCKAAWQGHRARCRGQAAVGEGCGQHHVAG